MKNAARRNLYEMVMRLWVLFVLEAQLSPGRDIIQPQPHLSLVTQP